MTILLLFSAGCPDCSGNLPLSRYVSSTVEEYDVTTNSWTARKNTPYPVEAATAHTIDNKIYVIGGYKGSHDPDKAEVVATVIVYDPSTDSWEYVSEMPTARSDAVSCAVNGRIYVMGGGSSSGLFVTVEEYDPATDTWTRKADMPTARAGIAAAVAEGKIYVIGGEIRQNNDIVYLSTVEEYDPTADTWTTVSDMPTERAWLFAETVNGKIYVVGGGAYSVPQTTVEEYDPNTDTWNAKPNMPEYIRIEALGVVNNKVYLVSPNTNVREYDPLTDTWRDMAGSGMPTRRAAPCYATVNDKIYVIGGHSLQ